MSYLTVLSGSAVAIRASKLVIKKLIKLILKIFGSLLTMTKEYVCLSAWQKGFSTAWLFSLAEVVSLVWDAALVLCCCWVQPLLWAVHPVWWWGLRWEEAAGGRQALCAAWDAPQVDLGCTTKLAGHCPCAGRELPLCTLSNGRCKEVVFVVRPCDRAGLGASPTVQQIWLQF